MPPGNKPKAPGTTVHRNPVAHPWQPAPAGGWKGRKPNPPKDLTEAAKKAWKAWFQSWWAAFWTPEDIPQLELAIKIYDNVLRGQTGVEKLTPLLDKYGITPKGRQDLRWQPPSSAAPAEPEKVPDELAAKRDDRRKKLA